MRFEVVPGIVTLGVGVMLGVAVAKTRRNARLTVARAANLVTGETLPKELTKLFGAGEENRTLYIQHGKSPN